ncbi:MAG: methyltransferase domain-containing protein [Planctomycetes bacterium]|nr:methyltransferase domain-containing protein [Planctomycetota bacterium]
MTESCMRFRDEGASRTGHEMDVLHDVLVLDDRGILEIGCGKAELTRCIAREGHGRRIIALECDEVQLTRNQAVQDLPNVVFQRGAGQAVPAADESFDVVLLFKSFHHVPVELMDVALHEMHRVLRPGGFAYVSEPLPEGAAFDVLRIFHDETYVRERAFEALRRSVEDGRFECVSQTFFQAPLHFADIADYEARVVNVTHQDHALSDAQRIAVHTLLERHLTPEGIHFLTPQRVDLLRKPVSQNA